MALQRWQDLQILKDQAAAEVSKSEHHLAKLAEVANPGAVAITDAEMRLKWHLNSDAVAKAEAEAVAATVSLMWFNPTPTPTPNPMPKL